MEEQHVLILKPTSALQKLKLSSLTDREGKLKGGSNSGTGSGTNAQGGGPGGDRDRDSSGGGNDGASSGGSGPGSASGDLNPGSEGANNPLIPPISEMLIEFRCVSHLNVVTKRWR